MRYGSTNNHELNEKNLPNSVYKSVVASLYADTFSMAVGIASCMTAAFVLFWKTLDPAQLIFASIFFLVGALRIAMASSFARASKSEMPMAAYRLWEEKYNISSLIFIMSLGFWYTNGLARTNDNFVQTLSLSIILCYLAGIIGRNFASKKIVRSQVLLAGTILVVSTLMFDRGNGIYNIALAAFMLPFFIATYLMSARLRGMLFKAEINAIHNETIANRFDNALENVAHGIAMLDQDGTVTVANERFISLVELFDWEIVGCHASMLKVVKLKDCDHNNLGDLLTDCFEQGEPANILFKIMSGLVIEADYTPSSEGGVITLCDVSKQKSSEKAIRELANYDVLTNLCNRRFFNDQVENYLIEQRTMPHSSMFFIDLDNFKNVNDSLGHSVGDELLRIVASRLKLLVKPGCVLGRFGGDEFVIFYPGTSGKKACTDFAKKIAHELSAPIIIRSHQIDIGCSIGIAIAPEHGQDVNTLLQRADVALYQSKAKGKSTYTFYSSELGEAVNHKRYLETELRQAINNDSISLNYQPLFDTKHCRIVGCEALARWDHPKLGVISPATFIELAEETGLIVQLGKNLLKKAMLECKKWPEDVRVAVNVSSIQFRKEDMFQVISDLLKETGLPANKLDIEVTESAMINNLEQMQKTLMQLSNLGIRISLDDFGTGYSSLSYLHSLPFDKIKIDKSFVENGIKSGSSLILLQGVVDLISRLGMKVIVEGVEDLEQFEIMQRSTSVHEYQGYHFFKPMKADELLHLFAKTNVADNRENIIRLAGKF